MIALVALVLVALAIIGCINLSAKVSDTYSGVGEVTCQECVFFTGCDLSDPDDEHGKCLLRIGDDEYGGSWVERDYTCRSARRGTQS